jgi:putative RNA 2'-phosphotransferase
MVEAGVMLRECKSHGYFRGEICPMCGDEGKFLLNEIELDRLGRIMAGCLRHFPQRYDLRMDARGFVPVTALIQAVQAKVPKFRFLRAHHLHAITSTDDKGRYEIRDNSIRATYGHTVQVDLDLPTNDIPDKLYYPLLGPQLEEAMDKGIDPVDRKKVHLSKSVDAAAAAGAGGTEDPVIVEVDAAKMRADGLVIMRAGTVVYLADRVPGQYLTKLDADIAEALAKSRKEREEAKQRKAQMAEQRTQSPRPAGPPGGGGYGGGGYGRGGGYGGGGGGSYGGDRGPRRGGRDGPRRRDDE